MLERLPKRKRRLYVTLFSGGLFLVAVALTVWLVSRPEPAYRPGEDIEGLTRELERDLPPDYPRVTFVDATAEAGMVFEHFSGKRSTQLPEDMGSGAAWGDYDNDGWLDLFVANMAGPLTLSPEEVEASPAHSVLYRNNGDGTFTEVSAQAGVDYRGWAMAAAWGDYNGDGWLDLFVTTYGENVFYENNGDGTFTDKTRETGLGGVNGFWAGASWSDFDRDGDLDLYVCGYVKYVPGIHGATLQYDVEVPASINPSAFEPERNLLYQNNGDGTFSEIAVRAGVADPKGRSLSAAWADFDEDGWPDLYVANDISDNVLFRNLGNGLFEDISHAAWVADYRGAMGIAVGDWDGDTDMDMFITHWIAQENALYSNRLREFSGRDGNGPALRFMDEADRFGLGQSALDYIGWGTSFFDYDNDGRLDLFVVNGSTFQLDAEPWRLEPMRDMLLWNRGPQDGFYDVSVVSGEVFRQKHVGRGAAFADYDNDGDVDVVVVNNGGPAQLLRNEGGNRNAWLKVQLQGTESNRFAVGARLRVTVGGQVQVRQVGSQSSYLSQNSLIVHFGLGAATSVDTLEVVWPSGKRETLVNVRVNQTLRLVEGRGQTAGSESASRETVLKFWQVYREATQHRIAGRTEAALQSYRRALVLNERHENTLYYLGGLYFETGAFREAERMWRRLLEVNPTNTRAHFQLGTLYLYSQDTSLLNLQAARQEFQNALSANQEETGPLLSLGQIALIEGDLAEADEYFQHVLGSNFKSVEAYYLRGYVAWKQGRKKEAESWFAQATQHSKKAAPVKGVLGEGDTKTGRALMRALRPPFLGEPLEGLADLTEEERQAEMTRRYRHTEVELEKLRRRLLN